MTRQELYQLLEKGPVFLDGATGTMLQEAGLPVGVCPEKWIMEHPDVIRNLQRAYVEAGTQILYAPTFTANRIKLEEYGLQDQLVEINRTMVRLSREAAGDRALVAGDLTMTGKQLYPTGDLMFEDLVDVYKEQVRAILSEGVDLFVVETMMSLQECRAALLAVKETCDLPVMISLTYNEDGRTLYGTEPSTAVIVLQSMGADIVGINCSTGPDQMTGLVRQMAEVATVPILAKPNAGLPVLENGKTVYRTGPADFADQMEALFAAGASVLGGCCGTTPEHIRMLFAKLSGQKSPAADAWRNRGEVRSVTSERQNVFLDLDGKFLVVGERINPTGKKKLQEELRAGEMSLVCEMARSQEEAGASILDINMGTNGIDEKKMMVEAVYEVTSTVDLPLCLDTSYVDVMEAALRVYPGRALINSISCEEGKMEPMLALAKKYGAMFVLLPLSSVGLPKDMEEKRENIQKILETAEGMGISRKAAVVDVLVNTVGANPSAARECFDTISYCRKELGLPTICGLSNISFGMPQRAFVNTAFLNVALSKGLNMAIANPSQEMLMYSALAVDMLLEKPGASERYLESVPQGALTLTGSAGKGKDAGVVIGQNGAGATGQKKSVDGDAHEDADPVKDCVVKGKKGELIARIEDCLKAGETPSEIIENHLIPGINLVGDYYDQKKYFLPQLIAGANAMKLGMEYLEPMLASAGGDEAKATIVFATVEGDIHDIGKNLVVLMVENYGFHVIDLGKDVPASVIVDKALETDASVIGLSALMTTTMMRMKDVVELAKEKNCHAKIIIGGAAITESFAEEIGADGYSRDASDCVKLVQRLTGE